MSDNIQLRKDVPSGTIMINRPDQRNSLTTEMTESIRTALEDFQQEHSVRAIILTGAGTAFSSGSDLKQLDEQTGGNDFQMQWHNDTSEFKDLIEFMLRYPKPIIASVNGPVVGSGLALMLACDIVVASEPSFIQMPETRLGLASGFATPLLAFRIGSGLASYIMLTAQSFDSARCREMGLFHEVVAQSVGWARCQEIAKQVAEGARHSNHLIKQMLNDTMGEKLFTYLTIGAAHTATARCSENAAEGIKAFLEKRKPNWPE